MKTITIKAPQEATFLNQIPGFTFSHGILLKGSTGCGATTLALTNDEHFLIASPLKELIKNKVKQHPNVFGIYEGIKFSDFKAYIERVQTIKVMVTYNSVPKAITWFSLLGVDIKDVNLMVDEYHMILTSFDFRQEAMLNVINRFNEFKRTTFVSATPIEPNYAPKELEDLDVTLIEWISSCKIKPIRVKTNKPFNAVGNIIKKHLLNGYTSLKSEGNDVHAKELYIFVNSVTSIKDLIDECGLTNDKVKVICADTPSNKRILETTKISEALDENKPITFVTATCFVGTDFYSDSGLTIIVSSVGKKHTLLDIATDIWQIAGRIRNINNPFKNTLIHIYNTGAIEMTREEWNEEKAKRIEESEIQIESFNLMSLSHKRAWLKRVQLELEEYYTLYNPSTEMLEFNDMKVKAHEYMYSIVNEIYSNGIEIRSAYERSGFDMSNNQVYWEVDGTQVASTTRRRFRDVCEEYRDIEDDEIRINYEREYPILKEVRLHLGVGAFKTFDFKESSLRQALYEASTEVKQAIKSELQRKYKVGDTIALKDAKNYIQSVYDTLKLNKKAKATDLSDFFLIEEKKIRIDGVQTKVIIIK